MVTKPSTVKGAHYVPKFILKNFSFNEKQQLYAENMEKGKKYTTNINDACTRHRFYDYKTQISSLENLFWQIEDFVSTKINQIVENKVNIQLDNDDMYALIIYRASKSIRGQIFIEKHFEIKKFMEETEQAFKAKAMAEPSNGRVCLTRKDWQNVDALAKQYTPTHADRDEALDFMCSVLHEPLVNPDKYINDFQFELFYNYDSSFIINDRGFSVNLDRGEYWLPLSPDFMLHTYPKRLTPNYQRFISRNINPE